MKNEFLKFSKKKLATLLQVIPSIVSESNIESLLQKILTNTREVMQAERSSIFVYDEEKNELWTFVTDGGDNKEIRISADKGIVGWVVKNNETLQIKDAYQDDRFEKGVDQSTGFRTRAIMAMPIVARNKKVLGVLEVLNKKGGLKYFNDKDKNLLEAFCTLVAISLENSMNVISLQKNLDSISRYSNTLERYTSPQILDMLKRREDPTQTTATLSERAVLFCDIRNFTALSKSMGASEVVEYLNVFFENIQEVIIENNGNIEKIMGDSIMASFKSSDDALLSTCQYLSLPDLPDTLKCGFGLTFGSVLIGNIGSKHKLDYTLIGDIVNLASRLEKLTKKAGYSILTSAAFYDKLKDKSQLKRLGKVKIRGYSHSVPVFASHKVTINQK